MANSKQAKKRVRQSQRRRLHNMSMRSQLRTAIKNLRTRIKTHADDAQAYYRVVCKLLDQYAAKKIISKNKAARHKSRFATALKPQ